MRPVIMLWLGTVIALNGQQYTKGVGIYPGDPKQDFAPTLAPGNSQSLRNLALRRPAYQSSAYDYNLTAQLVTDGIKETKPPRWFALTTSDRGLISKQEREHPVDHNLVTRLTINGSTRWVQVELAGGDTPLEVDRVDVAGGGGGPGRGGQPATIVTAYVVAGSDDGQTWKELGRAVPPAAAGRGSFTPSTPVAIKFTAASRNRFLRITQEGTVASWSISELAFYDGDNRAEIGGPYNFSSAWKSAGSGEEWVYVDLGAISTFDRVVLTWIERAAAGSIQTSDDAKTWKTVQALSASGLTDDLQMAQPVRGRYVRVLMTKPVSASGYVLSEIEVYGKGGVIARPRAATVADVSGKMYLSGGAWRIERDSSVNADGATLSKPGFDDRTWLVATVPATVVSSYWNAGALPDPNFGANQLAISDSFFYADFWYRDEFVAPPVAAGRRVWLNFRGINWKAEVFLNAESLGHIDGAFMRGRFDVSKLLKPGMKNAIAVRIKKNATPGSVKEKTWESPDLNGGALGADNPTYHATVGWDWIPSVRGRDIGIWSDIYLEQSGAVTIENPFVSTVLDPNTDITTAHVTVEATLRNQSTTQVSGTLHGRFGDRPFDLPVTIEASKEQTLKHVLTLVNPKLWWPLGYGEPNLYKVDLTFETADHRVSDTERFQTGVRELTYKGEGNDPLLIYINGRRFVGRGGNWGFPESLLRYRQREYDTAVKLHKDMNFTMIRNWVGQTGDDEFFDACDKYGVMVWQDFWLANPSDGPNPDDADLFLANVKDFVLRVRNHPSIALWVGRNEGDPPPKIEAGLEILIADLHPGLKYIPNSANRGVSGGGPYRTTPVKQYFQRPPTKMHSEMGMPNVMTLDSVKQTMPIEAMWPQGDIWGMHDFTRTGAQGGATWLEMIDRNYGGAKSVEEFVELSQFINYDGYRAIFEAQGKNRMGVLLWMSHSCWPSFVWDTYDYYFDTSGGYFGSKKGAEPLHIQWNPTTDMAEVVNYSQGMSEPVTATVELLNMDGAKKWEKSATLSGSKADSIETPIKIEYPADLTPVHYIRLKLMRGSTLISENFYLRGLKENMTEAPTGPGPQGQQSIGYDLTAIRTMAKATVEATTKVARPGTRWVLTTELSNASKVPALMLRVKAVREKSGDRILPAIYSDNYVALMPGEKRTIKTELEDADTRAERPRIVLEGFNLEIHK